MSSGVSPHLIQTPPPPSGLKPIRIRAACSRPLPSSMCFAKCLIHHFAMHCRASLAMTRAKLMMDEIRSVNPDEPDIPPAKGMDSPQIPAHIPEVTTVG